MYWIKRKLKALAKCREFSETYFHNRGSDLVPVKIINEKDGCVTFSFTDGTEIILMKDYTYQTHITIQGE